MGAGHSAEDARAYSDPPAQGRRRTQQRRRRHSVDSVASYSSQNHVDRIRTQNFSAASCHDEDFGSIKTSLFRRSSSNLEFSVKRPDSVVSNTSSTRSRLREFVERKASQDEHKSAANTVADIQYFENPAETLEFDKSHSSLESKKSQDERPKKRKLSKKEPDVKNKKQEKYQSKLAEYYKVPPVQLPQDEFYQHLTKSRAAEEFLHRRFPNSDTEVSGSYGRLCKHKEVEGSNLRRSRSLAVIREETFTDLQLQNHTKNKRSQLIPRARLFDKPCFKDRLIGRAKYQTKEEVLEGIYIDSTVSCFGDISGQKEEQNTHQISITDCIEKDRSRSESRNSKSVSGSWPNLNDESKQINLSEDSIGHSRNPSEIDSLDSNYVRKHYNFEAHLKNYNESSPETERSVRSRNNSQELYITDDHDSEKGVEEKVQTPDLLHDYSLKDTEINGVEERDEKTIIDEKDNFTETKADPHCKLDDQETGEKLFHSCKNNSENNNCDTQSVLSENDETISSPPDSITSYISISIASSTDRSHKLEHLANSLAEKIDEYCDSQFENVVLPHNPQTINSESQDSGIDPIYTSVSKKTTFADIKRGTFIKTSENSKDKIEEKSNVEVYVTNIDCNTDGIDSKTRICSASTLVENQYYSLPDINISKCLRKCERIDAQLREEDPEDIIENTYGVNENHFRELLSHENYGQLNKNCFNNTTDKNITKTSQVFLSEYSEPVIIQNYSKLEDDLKSIITIESNTEQDCGFYHSDSHQNEREINEIEGTIRNNKLISKSESLKLSNNSKILRPEAKILKSQSNDNINLKVRDKPKTGIRKHYSLRQRDPNKDEDRLPSPSIIENSKKNNCNIPVIDLSFSEQIRNHSLLSRVQSFKTSAESEIAIVPLSGHQTIVINPPLSQNTSDTRVDLPTNSEINHNILTQKEVKVITSEQHNNKLSEKYDVELQRKISDNKDHFDDLKNSLSSREPFITIKLNKVVKATIPKLKSDSYDQLTNYRPQLHKPPSKLIIKDSDNNCATTKLNMTRPQILQVVDSTKSKKEDVNNVASEKEVSSSDKTQSLPNSVAKEDRNDYITVKDKLNNAIKTDLEYQVKINSVKNYWSNLIEKTPEPTQPNNMQNKDTINKTNPEVSEPDNTISQNVNNDECTPEVSVNSIVKSLESVKIVDSIRKLSQTKLQLWKDESEKVKSDSEIEEKPVEKIKNKENSNEVYDKSSKTKKSEQEIARDTPEIEIVELSSDDNQNQKTQATLIKAPGYEKGCDEFDHVRYKVMKSELFKNSMIANYRKEAQFDGLLQYLQDYSFQELLVNNNIVIIEPVRTKIEPAPRKNTNTDTCKIPPTLLKKNDQSFQNEKSKNSVRRHFFYHPIRVNKEIIEEELPNPDTVKKVRNLFEDTLKMKSPMAHDPPLVEEHLNLSRRSTSYRNLSEETKGSKGSVRKKVTRHLTIDTSFGNKKWDSASLSSGVSSGDLSSNNEYDNEALSPYSQKNLKDNTYSSSDEYLCDSANQDFCCESQYVSPDILKKIRDCGTSVTYYGGKVLNSKTGAAVSPMTKAIMDEIKNLQKNCSRDCYSCQTKCKGSKCSCLIADKHQKLVPERHNIDTLIENQNQDLDKRTDGFPGFKFKLVKSNSCSSRLELTGTDENRNARMKFRKQNSREDPPLVCEEENSVKNKICRLESYNKTAVNSNFKNKEKVMNKDCNNEKNSGEAKTPKKETSTDQDSLKSKIQEHTNSRRSSTQSNKQGTEANTFEKKFYYVNDTYEKNKVTNEKFGEMVFEEFEVLESCYDSLNSSKSTN
ncbi:protein javelin isoform X2 [Aricia agestis]|uniref:protein javelin isoform X2 n=1 Tax=Aricia agestis TaxID=91739 RepID=UPI001C206F57|nr:protein javelin isoform X2 [Aricia agestis]